MPRCLSDKEPCKNQVCWLGNKGNAAMWSMTLPQPPQSNLESAISARSSFNQAASFNRPPTTPHCCYCYSNSLQLHTSVAAHFWLCHLPESLDTILAICARSLLSSSCSAVVRFRAVMPGFFRPSILLPSRRKLGTDEFLWSTKRGVGRHSCFRGRESLLETQEKLLIVTKQQLGVLKHSLMCPSFEQLPWKHPCTLHASSISDTVVHYETWVL